MDGGLFRSSPPISSSWTPTVTPVNSFRILFNTFLGDAFPFLNLDSFGPGVLAKFKLAVLR